MAEELATMYVPILPDTAKLYEELSKISYEIRVAVRDGIILGIKDALATVVENQTSDV